MNPNPIRLPKPTPPQTKALNYPARFLVNRWGRGAGKSHVSLRKLHESAATLPGLYWWVWPTLKSGREFAWEQYIRPLLGSHLPLHESTLSVRYPNGSRLQVMGADNYRADNLRGGALRGVVLDECRNMKRRIWTEIIMSMVARTGGWAWFNSTPRGHDWFWQLWENAATLPDWGRLHFTSYDNPHFAIDEIERQRREMTEREFLQEVMAEFLSDGGLVFRNVDECSKVAATLAPTPGRQYVMGVDWGRSNDYTVATVLDVTSKTQVEMQRFSRVSFTIQEDRIMELWRKWNKPVVVPERNSMGGPIVERLHERGVRVYPEGGFNTSATSKDELVRTLALAMERQSWKLLKDETQRAELLAYEERRNPSNTGSSYGAPDGMHDDTVMALMLAVWGATNAPRPMTQAQRTFLRRKLA